MNCGVGFLFVFALTVLFLFVFLFVVMETAEINLNWIVHWAALSKVFTVNGRKTQGRPKHTNEIISLVWCDSLKRTPFIHSWPQIRCRKCYAVQYECKTLTSRYSADLCISYGKHGGCRVILTSNPLLYHRLCTRVRSVLQWWNTAVITRIMFEAEWWESCREPAEILLEVSLGVVKEA